MDQTNKENQLRRLLLGKIESKKERSEIDKCLMIDDDDFQLFEILEEELIQEYVDEELTEDERQQFEEIFFFSKSLFGNSEKVSRKR